MGAALQGKVAVVTGGSSGIGLATARELSRLGASVTVTGRSADRLAGALDTLPGPAQSVVADVAEPGSAQAVREGPAM